MGTPELILPLVNNNINSTIQIMKPVKQEDGLGCAVACVAFILKIPYSEALDLFDDGKRRVKGIANFYCPEIVKILKNSGLTYSWKKLSYKNIELVNGSYSIVFIKRSKSHPYGHFLARYNEKWMDPWINLPKKSIKAGFREDLPGDPTYVIYRI
ncbi:MAG: hypothetical protein Q7K55_03965 [Candidatus Levybacteria bacterium]|nr:hypothetical protein [Candidatus Levybacteria bacterium]